MKRITFFILSIFCLTACNNDLEKLDQPEVTPQIELIMPDAERVSVYSTATVNECRIETMWVIVFDGNTKLWAEEIAVSNITKNGQASQLLPQLKHKPVNNNTIVCIANMDALNLPADTATLTPSNINSFFRLQTKKFYSGGDAIPMYGEMTWSDMSGASCKMERAVAKVQVQMGTSVSDVTTKFSAESVTYRIYNSGNAGRIKPDASFWGASNPASPIPFTDQFNLVQKNGATEKQTHAYIHEYSSATRTGTTGDVAVLDNAFNANRQYIILEKNNNPGTTFYRLDFYNSADKKFLDTKRNHHYLFTINKVRSEGYTTLAQAQNNPGSNIEYTVRIDDDFKYITSNGQYAIVSSIDTIKIPTTAQTNLTVGSIRYQPSSSMTTNIVTTVNSATASSGFTLVAPAPTAGLDIVAPYDNRDIVISAPAGTTSGTVTFKLGNITHIIPIIRQAP